MKKFFSLMAAVAVMFTFAACAGSMTIGGEEKGKHTWLHGEIVIGQAFIQGKVLNGIILRFGKIGTLGIAHLLHASQRYL